MTTTAELKRKIENQGEKICSLTQTIEHRLEEALDWRRSIRKRPLQTVGIALGVGILLSGFGAPLLIKGVRTATSQVGTLAKGATMAYLMSLVNQSVLQKTMGGQQTRISRLD